MAASPDPSDRCKWSPWRKVKKDQLSQSCKLHIWSAPLVSGQQLTSIVSHPDSQPSALFSGLASPGVSFPAQGAIRPTSWSFTASPLYLPHQICHHLHGGNARGEHGCGIECHWHQATRDLHHKRVFHTQETLANSYSVLHLTKPQKCFIFPYLFFR